MSSDIYTNGGYVQQNPNYHVEDSPWKAAQIGKMLDKHKLQFNSVCEVGCGAGEILRQLVPQMPGAKFSGYDISPQAIAFAKTREAENLRFYCQDLLETNTEIYDLLLCVDVFEHVEDYFGFLRKLRTKAKWKIFHIPLDLHVQGVLRCSPIMNARRRVGHLHYFMKETALATLRDTGYEIVDYGYTHGGVELARKFSSYLAVLPRRLLWGINHDWAVRFLGGYSLLVLAK